jgi:hypothetical protein
MHREEIFFKLTGRSWARVFRDHWPQFKIKRNINAGRQGAVEETNAVHRRWPWSKGSGLPGVDGWAVGVEGQAKAPAIGAYGPGMGLLFSLGIWVSERCWKRTAARIERNNHHQPTEVNYHLSHVSTLMISPAYSSLRPQSEREIIILEQG